jgi:hypothetical protein
MSSAFVGTRSVISSDDLKQVLETLPARSRCYFLRWVHKVSGFEYEIPADFPSPEGEMLTPEFEVRWKQTPQGYDLLLLAHHGSTPDQTFQALGSSWIASDPLKLHLAPKGTLQSSEKDRQDTRFPNPFIYPDELELQQRYFQNQQTGTVHFVALTLKLKQYEERSKQ